MPQDANHLIWIDMEMTGLKPDTDRIIEIALVVTNSALECPIERDQPGSQATGVDVVLRSGGGTADSDLPISLGVDQPFFDRPPENSPMTVT